MECNECGGGEVLMEGNPYAEHVTFKCQECGNERKENTNHLRPNPLNIRFSEEVFSNE